LFFPAMLPPVGARELLILVRKRNALVICVYLFHTNNSF